MKSILILIMMLGAGYANAKTLYFDGGCFGGSKCSQTDSINLPNPYKLVLKKRRKIHSIRFFAHDKVGAQTNAKLKIVVNGVVIKKNVDIKANGSYHEIPVGMRGKRIRLRAKNDEIVIRDIEVDVGKKSTPSFPSSGICLGGSKCPSGKNSTFTIYTQGEYVNSLNFYAHDNVGSSKNGRVHIYVDGDLYESNIDIKKAGSYHSIDIYDYVTEIQIVASKADEVVIKELAIDDQYVNGDGTL